MAVINCHSVVGRVGRLAVSSSLKPAISRGQQPSGKAISPSTYAHGQVDLTPERVVVRGGLLEGGVLTLNCRTGRGPGGSSPKVTRLRCSVYVGDCSCCGIGEGRGDELRRVCHHFLLFLRVLKSPTVSGRCSGRGSQAWHGAGLLIPCSQEFVGSNPTPCASCILSIICDSST